MRAAPTLDCRCLARRERLRTDANVGTEGIEPSRLSAHDPKSCSSASSDTSPGFSCQYLDFSERQNYTARYVNFRFAMVHLRRTERSAGVIAACSISKFGSSTIQWAN
jgi:hypothetical protein